MGSSTVMMCTGDLELMMSTNDASVVDLPEPVGPVTSTSPRGISARLATTGGSPSCSSDTMSCGMARITAPTESRCRKTLTRKRPRPGIECEVSSSSSASNFSRCFWVRMA